MPRYIDADDLPFTRAEVRRALRLAAPAGQAAQLAAHVARLPAQTAEAVAAAQAARERGSTDPGEINPPSWHVGDELFALLACVSPRLSARVDRLMERRWERWTADAVRTETFMLGQRDPTSPPVEAVRRARRRVGRWKARWTRMRRRIEAGLREQGAIE